MSLRRVCPWARLMSLLLQGINIWLKTHQVMRGLIVNHLGGDQVGSGGWTSVSEDLLSFPLREGPTRVYLAFSLLE